MIEAIVRRSNTLTTNTWSGGTTTELFIAPDGACYADRHFDVRVSSAKVNVPESTFTALAGFDRHLMVLEGQLSIQHEGHHDCVLNPFESDFFLGDWTTVSQGIVTDFNLMLRRGLTGELESVELLDQLAAIINCQHTLMTLFYCQEGEVHIELFEMGERRESHLLYQGDVYYFENAGDAIEVEIKSTKENNHCRVVYCKVNAI